jgi:hypothetical protein
MKRGTNISRVWIPLLFVCLLCFGVEICVTLRFLPEYSLPGQTTAGASRGSGVPFAVADFDGDWKPDLAIVETASLRRADANYSIRLQFSTAAGVSFLVKAPDGGIRVAARDVNGDNLPDLIVSSVSDQRIVAVLVNHGHGEFSRAEPASFAKLAQESDVFFRGCEQSLGDKFTVVSLRYSFDGERMSGSTFADSTAAASITIREMLAQSRVELDASRGRSPPSAGFLS